MNPDLVFQAPWNLDPIDAESSMLACQNLLDAVEVVIQKAPPKLWTVDPEEQSGPLPAEVAFALGRYAAWVRGFVEHHGPAKAREAALRLRDPAMWGMARGEFERNLRGLEGDDVDGGPAWKAHTEAWRKVKRSVRSAMVVRDLLAFTIPQVWMGHGEPRMKRWVYSPKGNKPSTHFAAWVCTVLGLGPGACFVITGRHAGERAFWRTVLEGMTRDYAGCARAHRILDRASPVDLPELPPPEFPTPRSREVVIAALRQTQAQARGAKGQKKAKARPYKRAS